MWGPVVFQAAQRTAEGAAGGLASLDFDWTVTVGNLLTVVLGLLSWLLTVMIAYRRNRAREAKERTSALKRQFRLHRENRRRIRRVAIGLREANREILGVKKEVSEVNSNVDSLVQHLLPARLGGRPPT